jgi:ATP-dependent RNA helicase RhlE
MSNTFADLGVSRPVADALRSRGIESPFPVQELVINDVLSGHDVLVQSPTGSGKTLAFGVPIVDKVDFEAKRPAALILAPTRELACQIVDELESICRARGVGIAAVYGGVGIQPQIKRAKKAHILVATPGRLEDLIQRRAVDLSNIRMLVLDEADRMLDMGFRPPVDRIVALTPRKRQTLFFSATLEGATGEIAEAYTYKPRRHVHAPERESVKAISHRFAGVGTQSAKLDSLLDELRSSDRGRILVFVRTKRGADRLVKKLTAGGVKSLAMHGDKSQGQRQKALARFERGDLQTLVATDVAARGIDVSEIAQVINFDIPEDADTYTHRVGRTGRAGAVGEAVSFVLPDQHGDVRSIAKALGLLDEFHAGVGNGPGPGAGNGNGNAGRRNGGGGSRGPRNRPQGKSGNRKSQGGKSRGGDGGGNEWSSGRPSGGGGKPRKAKGSGSGGSGSGSRSKPGRSGGGHKAGTPGGQARRHSGARSHSGQGGSSSGGGSGSGSGRRRKHAPRSAPRS